MTDIEMRIGRIERKQDLIIHLLCMFLSVFAMLPVGITTGNAFLVVLAPCILIVGIICEIVLWKRREKKANKASELTS